MKNDNNFVEREDFHLNKNWIFLSKKAQDYIYRLKDTLPPQRDLSWSDEYIWFAELSKIHLQVTIGMWVLFVNNKTTKKLFYERAIKWKWIKYVIKREDIPNLLTEIQKKVSSSISKRGVITNFLYL